MSCLNQWPEPVIPVQWLAESGCRTIPDRYVRRPEKAVEAVAVNIPIVDLRDLRSPVEQVREKAKEDISRACREWGFFQVVNHGVDFDLIGQVKDMWREFFGLPLGEKQKYANSPNTYEGYGSRLGVEKGAKLDWSDYFFLNFLPTCLMDPNKWPHLPLSCRELTEKYCKEVTNLGERLTRVLSEKLGLKEGRIHEAFGGDEERSACMRVNYYPKCPQPELALGLSPHSDPGGLTILLADADVAGLQVFHDDTWITVKPLPNAFIVNVGDQIQVMSNGKYKSVEHRVIVNSGKERVSLAFFYNPGGDVVVKPLEEVVGEDNPPIYAPMTFNQYRSFIRSKGPQGKFIPSGINNNNNNNNNK